MQWKRQLGDFELEVLSDGAYLLDGGQFFGIVPKVLWQKKVRCDEQNRVVVGLNSLLVRTGAQTILIETGIGNKLNEKMRQIYQPQGKLMQGLDAAGVTPEKIDIVINSHLHFDHCGWNTVPKDGAPVATFPNAKYYAPRGEWETGKLQRERDGVSYISANYDPVIQSGQMHLLGSDGEIVPGIWMRNYPGHTRSMMAVMIQSGGQTACYISDLIPTSAHLDLTWGMSFDLFPLETIENKKRFYKEAIPGKWLVIFTHDHERPWAHLDAGERGKVLAHEP
jgi:glyoxylase-like metal-dependent hydrolase (beta-lactamase superfamily II)